MSRGLHRLSPEFEAAIRLMMYLLGHNTPRQIDVNHMDCLHIYVDASFEPIVAAEEELGIMCWSERVPSFSNPADALSRKITERCRGVSGTRVDLAEIWRRCQNEKKSPSLRPGGGREA